MCQTARFDVRDVYLVVESFMILTQFGLNFEVKNTFTSNKNYNRPIHNPEAMLSFSLQFFCTEIYDRRIFNFSADRRFCRFRFCSGRQSEMLSLNGIGMSVMEIATARNILNRFARRDTGNPRAFERS